MISIQSKIIFLSHALAPDTPAYGGGEGLKIEHFSQITAGDTANTLRYTLPNHLGTHIDAPRHFFDSGNTLTDFPAEFWIFKNPLLIDITANDGYLITPDEVEMSLKEDTDLLLIRTGFETYRGQERYWKDNPGIDPQLAIMIRKSHPKVRAVGIDFISLTSWHHRKKGREAHRNFLCPNCKRSQMIVVEDMALSHVKHKLSKVIVCPLMVLNADGGPCSVFGFY